MINILKISQNLQKKRCPICGNSLKEEILTDQKFSCHVACNKCRISCVGHHFYDCYDELYNVVVIKLRNRYIKTFKKQATY